MLDEKETQVRNLEKEIENMKNSLKSIHARFDREKGKAEQFQDKWNKSDLQLQKAMTLLTEGNKAIKHKDMSLKSAHERIAKLNQFIKQVSQLGNGKTLSIDAINSALSQ